MSKENIGDVIAKTLEGEPPATVSAPRTLDQIAADIVRKDQQVGLGLISIGNDLIEAKERVEHGKWREWLDLNVGYSERKAQMCMQVARRYGSNPQLVADLGIRKVTALMLLPSGEDAEFLETHDVPNMSTRELEQAIRERDEAKAAAEAAAIHAGQLQRELDDERQTVDRLLDSSTKYEETNAALVEDNKELAYKLRQTAERVKDLESAPKEVYQDEAAIRKAADEARAAAEAEWSAKVKEAEDKLAKAKEKAEKAEEKAKKAGEQTSGEVANLKAEAEQLRAELERAKLEQAKASISGDADLAAFQLLFEAAQTDVNKMRGILLKVRGRENSELGEKLTAALLALAEKVKECAA